jgi:hypothetical protein
VFSGKTDENGTIPAIPLVSCRFSQPTGDPRKITTDERGPFRVHVEANGKTAIAEINLSGNQDVTLRLAGKSSE